MTTGVEIGLLGSIIASQASRLFMPRPGPVASGGTPITGSDVSIIVPARNEAERLPALLASISRSGATPREIIVVDDHSTDVTAALARAAGARVVQPDPLPAGWTGKTFACHTGARAATGHYFLFLDADVAFEPGGFAAMLERAGDGRVWSFCPYHRVERPYESLSLYFNLLMVAGTESSGRALFGQSLLISKTQYDAVGGHEAVRGHVLENFFLGALLRDRGFGVSAATANGILAMHMYPEGVRALVRGWAKAFATGAAHTPAWVLALSGVWMGAAIFTTFALLTAPWTLSATASIIAVAAYGAHAIELYRVGRTLGTYPWYAAALYPLALGFYQVLFATALIRRALGRTTSWKDRDVAPAA